MATLNLSEALPANLFGALDWDKASPEARAANAHEMAAAREAEQLARDKASAERTENLQRTRANLNEDAFGRQVNESVEAKAAEQRIAEARAKVASSPRPASGSPASQVRMSSAPQAAPRVQVMEPPQTRINLTPPPVEAPTTFHAPVPVVSPVATAPIPQAATPAAPAQASASHFWRAQSGNIPATATYGNQIPAAVTTTPAAPATPATTAAATSTEKSVLKGFGGKALGAAGAVAFGTYDGVQAYRNNDAAGVAGAVGGTAGSVAGAEVGGALGLLGGPAAWLTVPAGMLVGGYVGNLIGNWGGQHYLTGTAQQLMGPTATAPIPAASPTVATAPIPPIVTTGSTTTTQTPTTPATQAGPGGPVPPVPPIPPVGAGPGQERVVVPPFAGYRDHRIMNAYFKFDHADLSPEAREAIAKDAKEIEANGALKVTVTGHTDTMGGNPYNQRLSERRAEAVKAELEKDLKADGYDKKIEIKTEGVGKGDQEAPTGDQVKEAKNRRVTLKMEGGKIDDNTPSADAKKPDSGTDKPAESKGAGTVTKTRIQDAAKFNL